MMLRVQIKYKLSVFSFITNIQPTWVKKEEDISDKLVTFGKTTNENQRKLCNRGSEVLDPKQEQEEGEGEQIVDWGEKEELI